MNKIKREDFESLWEYYESKYEEFWTLLVCFFANNTTDKTQPSDLDRIIHFLYKSNGRDVEITQQTIKEGREVLKLKPFPWEWIGTSCNKALSHIKAKSEEERYFIWTKQILDTLEEEARKQGKL